MAVATESFLHLARPLAPAVIGVQPTTAPLNVILQPQVGLSRNLPCFGNSHKLGCIFDS